MSGITIPEALRSKLLPRRSLPGSARPATAAEAGRSLAKTFPKKPESHWDKTYAQLFEGGLRHLAHIAETTRFAALKETAAELVRASAIKVPARKLLGTMESRGWQRDAGGFVSAWLRPVRSRSGDPVMARWPLSQGIEMESLADAPDAVTGALVVEGPEGAPVLLGDVDDVAFSEIIRDVEAVRGL